MVADQPLLGVGAGNFSLALRRTRPGQPYTYQPVHNVFYLAAAELGVLGAVWWGALLLIPIGITLFSRSLPDAGWSAAYGAMLASLLVIGLFDYYVWAAPHGRLLVALSMGLWYTVHVGASEKKS